MAKEKVRSQRYLETANKAVNLGLIALLLISLIFYTTFADPINVPKFLVLILSASWLLGYLLPIFKIKTLGNSQITFLRLTLVFIGIMTITALLTDNLEVAFFGDNLRKNGVLNYLALALISLVFAFYFSSSHKIRFFAYVLIINSTMTFYGFIQILGIDPLPWTGSGGIFSTIGNSNFAGTVFSILFVLSAISIHFFNKQIIKFFISILVISNLICIYFTNARQSQIMTILAICIMFLYFINSKSKKLFYFFFTSFILGSFLILLGIFNKGPLGVYIYKNSVSVRGFYWKSAFKMIQDHPFLGVGIDRYGAFFKEVRDVNYPLKYGWDLTSTNAHNLPLQMFATGGLFLGLSYLILMTLIFWLGIKSVRSQIGESRYFNFGILLAWLVYQIQTFVSVDNVAMAIWGWVLAGIIVANYSITINQSNTINSQLRISREKQLIISALLVIPTIFVSFNLARAESNMFQLIIRFNPNVQSDTEKFKEIAVNTLKIPFLDQSYKVQIGGNLIDYGYKSEGLKAVQEVLQKDQRDLQSLWILAMYSENTKNFNDAISLRKKIEILDPWNAKNYYFIITDFYNLNDNAQMKIYAEKIRNFAGDTDIGKQLKNSFPNL